MTHSVANACDRFSFWRYLITCKCFIVFQNMDLLSNPTLQNRGESETKCEFPMFAPWSFDGGLDLHLVCFAPISQDNSHLSASFMLCPVLPSFMFCQQSTICIAEKLRSPYCSLCNSRHTIPVIVRIPYTHPPLHCRLHNTCRKRGRVETAEKSVWA